MSVHPDGAGAACQNQSVLQTKRFVLLAFPRTTENNNNKKKEKIRPVTRRGLDIVHRRVKLRNLRRGRDEDGVQECALRSAAASVKGGD